MKYKHDSREHTKEYMLKTKNTNTYSGSNNLYYNTTSATSGEVAAHFSGAL
jgi:hypothetical protein